MLFVLKTDYSRVSEFHSETIVTDHMEWVHLRLEVSCTSWGARCTCGSSLLLFGMEEN